MFEPYDEMDTWSRERIERLAWRRLRRVLHHAYDHVSFYRRRFDAARLRPADIRSPADLARLPRLTKAEILRQQDREGGWPFGMEVQERREPAVFTLSSGTFGTGILYIPESWVRARSVSSARAFWTSGLRPGMRVMTLVPSWHGGALCERWVFEKLIPVEAIAIPWGTSLPHFAGKLLDTLLEWRPHCLNIFLPMLYSLLAECRRRGIQPTEAFAGIRFLSPVGAPTSPRGRRQLIEILGVEDIFEGYGNVEVLTAPECSEHSGHHIMMDTAFVEVVDPETGAPLSAGQRGSLVLTSLIPHGSIFLRLEIEDIAELLPEPCPCGRAWPLLEVYDRVANRFIVAGQCLVPYDVRLCLDEVDPLVGVPCAVIRSKGDMSRLHLVMERPPMPDLDGIAVKAAEQVRCGLGLETVIEWVETLPVRWKSTPVIEEEEWRNA